MVTARAFANVTTDRTIYFMLFGAEEQGLIGSEVFVEEFYETGEYVAHADAFPPLGAAGLTLSCWERAGVLRTQAQHCERANDGHDWLLEPLPRRAHRGHN